jgi:hypothetical protein
MHHHAHTSHSQAEMPSHRQINQNHPQEMLHHSEIVNSTQLHKNDSGETMSPIFTEKPDTCLQSDEFEQNKLRTTSKKKKIITA